MDNKTLKINNSDNIVVALTDLKKNDTIKVNNKKYILLNDIKAKHKFSIQNIETGQPIHMYGVVVGKAKKNIKIGEKISLSNIIHQTENYFVPKKTKNIYWNSPNVKHFINTKFHGYIRDDGKVGTENNWLVIPLVFCQNRNIDVLKKNMIKSLGFERDSDDTYDLSELINKYRSGASISELSNISLEKKTNSKKTNSLFSNIDGLYFLTHEGGCGGTSFDSESLCNLIAGYINNPNVGGATILSLGCQHAQINILKKSLEKISPNLKKPVYYLEQQKSKSENHYISEAIKKTFIGLTEANKISRSPAPLSKLVIGLECGGSDGFSGISANPTLGHVTDLIVGLGGSAILSEFPELNGVEQELIDRCVNIDIAKKFNQLMTNYNSIAAKLGSGFYANPSPGNIKDGLITDAIKSAGAAKKGGTSPIVDVLDYTEQVIKKGLNLLCTPGNDVESTTGLAGSGANLILFTTGLGTPTGNPAVPVIKISSNSSLFQKMHDIIDFDTGSIIVGKKNVEECAFELLNYIIDVASGKIDTKARLLDQNDFIPWKRGVSL
ncbi:MAG: altronate dehydratase family protein [Bacteroidota bacterium]|nr:altronate dehydratase family protein [Bacteroidota bacterium]